jgi:hypothetical protein
VVDWKSSGTQLISGIVGSSLFLFGITTFYTDYLQKPRVEINTIAGPIYPNMSTVYDALSNEGIFQEGNETSIIIELKYDIQANIKNAGNTPATDVIMTCLLQHNHDYIVTDKPLATSEENFTKILEEPKLVTWEMPRLAAGSTFIMHVNVTQSISSDYFAEKVVELQQSQPGYNFVPEAEAQILLSQPGNNLEDAVWGFFSPSYNISAAANQGTEVKSARSQTFSLGSYTTLDFDSVLSEQLANISAQISAYAPLIALTAVSASIIFMPRISDIIKRRRVERDRVKMVSAVYSEIKIVRDALSEDINSKRIFPCKVWYSASSDLKRQVFDNYADYKSINDFYEELEIRDSLFAANSDAFRINNKELLQKSDDILRKIRWAKYLMIHFSVPLAITTLGSLAVIFGELLVVISLQGLTELLTMGEPTLISILQITNIVILTISGTVITFAVLEKILNIQSIFSKSDGNQFKLTLPRAMQIRLFGLCFILGIVPGLLGVSLSLYITILMRDSQSVGNILSIAIGVVPQIVAMFLLVSYAARKIKKSV